MRLPHRLFSIRERLLSVLLHTRAKTHPLLDEYPQAPIPLTEREQTLAHAFADEGQSVSLTLYFRHYRAKCQGLCILVPSEIREYALESARFPSKLKGFFLQINHSLFQQLYLKKLLVQYILQDLFHKQTKPAVTC